MKTLQDLGITIIKPQHKEGNDTTKEAIYGANSIIFQNLKTPISLKRKERISKGFTSIGVTLSQSEVHGKAEEKKKEILDYLRKYLRILKEYDPQETTQDRIRVIKYQVSQYLRNKDKLTTVEDICGMLEQNQQVAFDYGSSMPLVKAQDELLDKLKENYEFELIPLLYE